MAKARKSLILLTNLCLAVGLFLASAQAQAAPRCDWVWADESVIPWNQNLGAKIANGDWFGSEEFYRVFQKDSEKTRKLIAKWYSYIAPELLKAFEALPEEYHLLLIDPSIATRAADFVRFAGERLHANPQIPPREMRRLFADSLGTSKVYRGLLLSPAEAEAIRTGGMLARALDRDDVEFRLKIEFDGDRRSPSVPDEIRQGFVGEVNSRLAGRFLNQSMLLSTSKWIEVTSAAAWSPKGKELQPEKKFYLFEIEVPEFRLLRLQGPFHRLNAGLGSWRYFETRQFGSNENFRRSVEDPDFEIFIFGAVPPSQIKAMHAYDQRPPLWWPAN